MNLIEKNGKFYIRKQHEGKRKDVALGTDKKTTAQQRGTRFLATLEATGSWSKAVAELKGKEVLKPGDSPSYEQMRELYEEFQKQSPKPVRETTREQNLGALKRLMERSKARTIGEIDTTNLGENPTANVRLAKSIFKPAALVYYRKQGVTLQNPFTDFEMASEKPTKYDPITKDNAKQIWKDALDDKDPVTGLIILLAMGAGLRRSEIDKARVSWLGESSLKVQQEEDFIPKSRENRTIPIGEGMVKLLLEQRGKCDPSSYDPYLVPGRGRSAVRHNRKYRALPEWFRKRGVEDSRPLHSMRKYYGSVIFTKLGVEAAASYLGHSSIQLTYSTYADLIEKQELDVSKLFD